MKKKDGGPAFPVVVNHMPDSSGCHSEIELEHEGMSLRDFYAGQAVVGMLSGNVAFNGHAITDTKTLVKAACELADAMIEARGK